MKNIMNRMISVILVMALLLSTMVFPAFAAEEDASFSVYESADNSPYVRTQLLYSPAYRQTGT